MSKTTKDQKNETVEEEAKISNGKPSSGENLGPNGLPVLSTQHVSLLKAIQNKKQNIYHQLGIVKEAEIRAVEDLKKVQETHIDLIKEIQEAHPNLPLDKAWQLNHETNEIIVSEDVVTAGM